MGAIRSTASHGALVILLLLMALCAAEMSRLLSAGVSNMSAVWPSLGIAVGAAMVLGRRMLLGYVLVMLAWFLWQEVPAGLAGLSALQQGAEAWLAVTLLQRFLKRPRLLVNLPDTLRFYWWGAMLPTLPLTLLASWSVRAEGIFANFSLLDVWLVFWLAETLGIMLFAPLAQYLAQALRQGVRLTVPGWQTLLFTCLMAALLLLSHWLMNPATAHYGKLVSYLFFPLLAWAAMSRQHWMAVTGMPLVGVVVPALVLAGTTDSQAQARFELVEAVVLVTLMTIMTQLIQSASRERRRLSDQFRDQAHRDFSSGLLNDRGLMRRLHQLGTRAPAGQHWLAVLELRNFERSRQLFEESFGRNIERFVGRRIVSHAGEAAEVARLGAGRFGFLVSNLDQTAFSDRVQGLWQALHGLVYEERGRVYRLSVAIGTAPLRTLDKPDICLAAAGHAVRHARRLHGQPIYHSSAGDQMFLQQQQQLARLEEVKAALDEDRFLLFCQEIRSVSANAEGVSFEVLVRMRGDDGSVVSPAEFLPVAQDYGLMGDVDRCVVRKTFEWLHDHPEMTAALDKVSVNLSGATLSDPGFMPWLETVQARHAVAPCKICFEVTESEMIADWEQARQLLQAIRDAGFRISLDDFGTGLATFEYLTGFPFDFVKIDGLFIRDLIGNSVNQAIVRSVTSVASTMGLKTIAEFVGDQQLVPWLGKLGVDYMQGFAIGRPMPIGEFMLRLDEFGAGGALAANG